MAVGCFPFDHTACAVASHPGRACRPLRRSLLRCALTTSGGREVCICPPSVVPHACTCTRPSTTPQAVFLVTACMGTMVGALVGGALKNVQWSAMRK